MHRFPRLHIRPPMRTAALTAVLAVTSLACAGETMAKALDPPRIGRSTLVAYPGPGHRLALHVPVLYRGTTASDSRRPIVSATVSGGGGSVRAIEVDHFQADANGTATLNHRLVFSPAASRAIRRGLAGGGARLQVRADDRIGPSHGIEKVGSATRTQPLTRVHPAAEVAHQIGREPPGRALGSSEGTNPCGLDIAPSNCQNASGTPWDAEKFWSKDAIQADCPSGTTPATFVDGATGITHAIWQVQTSSSEWTTYWPDTETSGQTMYGGVIDWNVSGHPVTYTLWAACTT